MQTTFHVEIRFWIESLVTRCYKDHMSRKILDKMGMTLRSLETYGYIDSKTKSYRIIREFLLLFIFHAFWPYKAGLLCFFNQQILLLITLFRLNLSGLSEFLNLFSNKPFYWKLLGLCLRANYIPTIL